LKVRIASVSLVKDEADIIEAFVRHNLVFVDRMFIIDDQSSDNTSEILRRHQKKRTTAALNLVRKIEDWDCVLALDADEFIGADARSTFEAEIRAIPPGSPGGFRAIHYCIHPTDDSAIHDPLARIKHATSVSSGIFKSFLTRELLQIEDLAFSDGNHYILANGALLENTWPLPSVVLAHFPVRSMDQIAIKLLRQYVGWLSRADYEGHLRMSVEAALALKDEPSFALGHGSKVFPLYFNFVPNHIDLKERPFRERQGVVKWPELAVSPPYAQLMGLLDGWIRRLSAIDHLSMFSGERDQVAALKRLLDDKNQLHDELWTLKHSRIAAGKTFLAAIAAGLKHSWRRRFRANRRSPQTAAPYEQLTGDKDFAPVLLDEMQKDTA
jgi:hypothetical protein